MTPLPRPPFLSARRTTPSKVQIAAAALTAVPLLAAPLHPGAADARSGPTTIAPTTVNAWLRHQAVPIRAHRNTPAYARGISSVVGDARVVGMGEAVHGAREISDLKLRALKVLVRRLHVRSLAWEDDWTTGRAIDRYLRTGSGDVAGLVGRMTGQWQSRETLRVLRWLRSYDVRHAADPVRFVGVEYYFTGRSAYDAVEEYVRGAAPGRLPTLLPLLRHLQPTASKEVHAAWYAALAHKHPYVAKARRVFALVRHVPHAPRDRAHDLALHQARQIKWFYAHYDRPAAAQARYREPRSARNLQWWLRRTGDRTAYWAATPHTANASKMRIAIPGPDLVFASAGSFLRSRLGDGYVSIDFTLDHGTVGLAPDELIRLARPAAGWFESRFTVVPDRSFLLDLQPDGPVPTPVRRWLASPSSTRGLPEAGPDSFLSGGRLGQWFDALVHTRRVRPQHAL